MVNRIGTVAPEVDLERNIFGTFSILEDEIDRQAQRRDELELEAKQGDIVGAELSGPNAQLFIGLTGFVESLNEGGAFVVGGRADEGVSVEDLIDPDTKIRVQDFKLGSFEVGTSRIYSGVQLFNAAAVDRGVYSDITGGANIPVSELQSAFEDVARSIEKRPEIEAAMETALREAEVVNADIERLQADVDLLRASISEVDTKGKQPDPLPPASQVNLLNEVLQRYVLDDRFDVTRRIERLERAKNVFVPSRDPISVPPSETSGLGRQGFSQAGDASAKAQYESQLPIAAPETPAADLVSQGPSDPALRGRSTVPAETVSPSSGVTAGEEAASDPALRGRSTVTPETDRSDRGDPSPSRLSAAQIRDANQAEVEALLASQFGGFSFFLQKHRSELQVGLTADGQVVAADDPNAMTVKNVLDVIVDQGITAPTRVRGLLEQTDWFKNTDARMREYDVLTADMSEPQKTEYLEPVLDLLREEAQFLGFQLDPTRARDLAEKITREGEETDSEVIRGMLVAESAFNAAEVSASSFAAARDEIVAMSKRYFTPIDETIAAEYAQNIYVGTQTAEGVEQMFKEQAAINYPQLQNALNANVTPEQYFAPYKYEIERMLDRPNVDLYEEFGDVIQYIPDTGTDEARPMTLGEVRKYVRGLDEWQQSSQGTDSARALAFSIGRTFGEVA